jgi:parallel beta-helix repeat protein
LVNGLDAVRVTNGRFNDNDDEGIQFQASTTGAVGGNVANNNFDTGILLPATGVTDLGGNTATGNGVANCVNVSC